MPWRSMAGAAVVGAAAWWAIVSFTHHADDHLLRPLLGIFIAAAALLLGASVQGSSAWRLTAAQWRWLLAMLAAWGVSTALSRSPDLAWPRLVLYVGLGMLGAGVYLLHRLHRDAQVWPYLLAFTVVHALVLAQVLFWLVAVHPGGPVSRVPFHGNVRHFGYLGYLGAASAAALWMLSRRLSWSAMLLCAAGLFGLLQLGSRGGLLAWACFVVTGAALRPQGRIRWLGLCCLATAIALSAVWALRDTLPSTSVVARAERGEALQSTGRVQMWQDALRGVSKAPLLGHGPEGYRVSRCCEAPRYAKTVQPHNALLQLLLEFGLLGTTLLFALARSLWRPSKPLSSRPPGQDAASQALLAILAGLCVFSLVDGVFYYPVPLLMLAVMLGLLASIRRQNQPDDQ